jgi:hypothetical protein
MLRLTADLLARSPVFVNTLNDRELDLRGQLRLVVRVSPSHPFLSRQPAAGH